MIESKLFMYIWTETFTGFSERRHIGYKFQDDNHDYWFGKNTRKPIKVFGAFTWCFLTCFEKRSRIFVVILEQRLHNAVREKEWVKKCWKKKPWTLSSSIKRCVVKLLKFTLYISFVAQLGDLLFVWVISTEYEFQQFHIAHLKPINGIWKAVIAGPSGPETSFQAAALKKFRLWNQIWQKLTTHCRQSREALKFFFKTDLHVSFFVL